MMTIAECLSADHDVFVFWDRKEDIDELLQRFSLNLLRVKFTKNIFSPKVTFLKRLWETRKYDVIIFLSDGSIPLSFSKKLFLHLQQPIPGIRTNFWTRWKISKATKVFCNSYYSKSYVDKDLGVDSLVLYPPVIVTSKKVKKENIILHVGRFRVKDPMLGISDYKKQDVMVKTFKEMVKNGLKNWKFILAVSVHREEENIFNRLKEKNKGFPIEFFVNKSNDELWNLYSRAKIYWHASGFGEDLDKHPEYAEHFGISTVEAMRAGAVPIVFNAGGQREIVKDRKNGLLWNTLQELEDKTLWAIEDKVLWQRLSESAKSSSRAYSKERFCRELNEIITS